jgi:hypothetical protein
MTVYFHQSAKCDIRFHISKANYLDKVVPGQSGHAGNVLEVLEIIMKIAKIIVVTGLVSSLFTGAAFAQTAPAPGVAPSSSSASVTCVTEKMSSDSLVGDILDNPTAKAILIKHVPEIGQSDQIEQARPMTLRSLQDYAAEAFTDKVLAELDADFATIPVCPVAAQK